MLGSTWVRDKMVSRHTLPPLTIEQETSWKNMTRGLSQAEYTAWQNSVNLECHDLTPNPKTLQ